MLIFKKEKLVIGLIFDHIDKVAECVQESVDGMKAYVSGDSGESSDAISRVNILESESDALLREIRDLLYSGAYLPLIRSDIYRLMSAVDDVSNKAENCSDFFHYQGPMVPDEYRGDLVMMLDLTAKCFREFRKALKHFFGPKDRPDKVVVRSRNVSELESQIDEKERALTARVFSSSLELSEKLHLRRCITKLAQISDTIEDATDELELVAMKSIV